MAGVDILASVMTGGNAAYLADLYARWVEKPDSVDISFAELFAALNDDARAVLTDASGASWAPRARGGFAPEEPVATSSKGAKPSPGADPATIRAAQLDSIRALMLIRSYRVRGHLEAQLDPLGLQPAKPHPELQPEFWGFTTEADLNRPIFIDGVLGLETATPKQIIERVRDTYCGPIGVEFMHIQDPGQKSWIQQRIEGAPWNGLYSPAEKEQILTQLTEAEGFEAFCAKKYVGTKRFGLEGGETTISAVQTAIETSTRLGTTEIAIGMAHRGRLNVLVNVVKKPYVKVFAEFKGSAANPEDVGGSGDVKYHLGTSADLEINGHKVHLSLQPNPSHLEAVDPVVIGKIRARQDKAGDINDRASSMAILLHGDAAFAGQGLVYETLAMSQLVGYRTGGTLHIVTNNQIGFTTVPVHAYSGLYCTDVAKSIQAPIIHVNGDNPEAVVWAARLITEYRMTFHADIVLDIVCYRRHGHNEGDEPAFTQPQMYARIKEMKTVRTLYAEKLASEGSVSAERGQAILDAFNARLEEAFQAASGYKPNKADWLEGHWSGLKPAGTDSGEVEEATAVPLETLREVGAALCRVPATFTANPKITRQLEAKRATIDNGEGLDWATGEALAFGTLLLEGHRVRLSGEDVQRGTFSNRHAVLIDQVNQVEYAPLNNVKPGQAMFQAFNSLLSEMGVLGFDYGYSLADPNTLVLWEAQFGDFANGAQVIIDQFIASGETKWLRMSGLVMLLPHGYEGQGPEHSSARLERYLQLCAERNMRVCNFTTPANYFHALRRQLKANYRKPLVVMTPKSLLRHKLAVSSISDFGPGSAFRFVIPEIDAIAPEEKVRRVVLCTGKVYYDLLQERRDRKIDDVALIRVEQLYPFPKKTLTATLAPYKHAEVVWCQEEPENMGAWHFLDRRIEKVLLELDGACKRPVLVGRANAASPATGLARTHAAQQEALVKQALGL
ncbi:MAG: 2-oxoglutarate dehydrogenase E1 component [Rubritepida sp.]|nr:2-oxoglutarate dehydrogenase E1 component [Rubritepida sp.]